MTRIALISGDRMKRRNPHIGSFLDEFLREEGILEETRAVALKETLAWQLQKAMKRAKVNKGGNGAPYAYKPGGAGPPPRSGQCFSNPSDFVQGRAGNRARS